MERGPQGLGPEDEFFQALGLINPSERSREVLNVYREAIVEILATGNPDSDLSVDYIKPDSKFTEDLDADSLAFLEVLEVLQEKLDIDLPTEAFEATRSAGEAFKVLHDLTLGSGEEFGDDDNLSGDREPRKPLPSAPGGTTSKDLPG